MRRVPREKWRRHPLRRAVTCSIALLACGCGSAGGSVGFVDAVVQAETSAAQLTAVTVTVSPDGSNGTLLPDPTDPTGKRFVGTLTVAAGPQTVTALALVGTNVVGRGSASVAVVAGQRTPVSITIQDATGASPVPDHSPVVTSVSGTVPAVDLGEQLSFAATALDADGDSIAFSWAATPTGCGTFSAPGSASTTWTAAALGTCTVAVTATAGGKTDSKTASIAVHRWTFPLKAGPTGRYFVDQRNRPFFIQGDSAQSMIANLTYAEAQTYFNTRDAQGFTAVNVNLYEHKFAQGGLGVSWSGVPTNRNGDLPFLKNASGGTYDGTWGTADFSTPNENYFAFADSIIDLAASHDMLVSLAYSYMGFGGRDEGWWADLTNGKNTQDVCFAFGQYLGNRYKNRPNILWVVGGDFTPLPGSEGEALLHKILEGLKTAGATQPQAGDWSAPTLSTDEAAFAAAMDANAVYTYGPSNDGATYDEALKGFMYTPVIPAYLKETVYESEDSIGSGSGAPAMIRKYQYWSMLSGTTAGLFYGHRDIWEFSTSTWWSGFPYGHAPWSSSLQTQGAGDTQRMGELLGSLPWYSLVPSGARAKPLVTSGGGSYGTDAYITAAVSADGSTLLAYVPPCCFATKFSIDMTALSAPARARWFDPSNGIYSPTASPIPNTGTASFTAPGTNQAGAFDWVLVLDPPP